MNHKQLVQQMTDMKAELDKYQAELTRLHSQISVYEDVEAAPAPANTSSRRKLLKRMAIAGIGGIGALGLAASVGSTNTVLAETAADNAIEAVGGSGGYGLRAQGGLAPLFLVGGSTTGAPVAGAAHQVGELYASSTGQLYYCVTAGNPGTWRQISGSGTAGSLHLLASPSRFVDTRSPGINDAGGVYTHNVSRNYQLTNLTGSGSATIPTGATGVVGNITVVGASAAGFGAVYAGTFNNTSNINFAANDTLANSFSSPLDSNGNITVLIRFPGATATGNTNVLLDIAGYYL